MDKTPVSTRTLEEELVERILTIYSGDNSVDASVDVQTAIADFRQNFEDECWEAWRIAQAFEKDEKYSRYLDDIRILNKMRESFFACVAAYNREREKEGKPEHVFTDVELPAPPCEEHPDNCIHHDE